MILLLLAVAAAQPGDDRAPDIARRIADPDAGVIAVAHRGCHAAAPAHRLASAPENSLPALDHCVAIGVDVMETDVRRTKDGALVMIHDATLDRTTDGTGRVDAMTLPQLKALRLRADLGGPDAPLTDERIVTLGEMLARAGDRIVLNLDIKDAIYPEVIDAVARASATERVIVKTVARPGTAPLAAMPPYDRVPFMPVLRFGRHEEELTGVMRTQLGGSRRPQGVELPRLTAKALPALANVARTTRVRLWINTLDDGYVAAIGGDREAQRDPAAVWGRLRAMGISMFQTDAPEALVAWRDRVR